MTTQSEPISVILPVRNLAGTIDVVLTKWIAALKKLERGWELIAVDDGSTDETASKIEANPQARLLKHSSPLGYGASVRTALAEVKHPLVLLTAADYPYSPSDISTLLTRMETEGEIPDPATGEFVKKKPDLVSGCRTGAPMPKPARILGGIYRNFCKIALGFPVDPLPGWYGFRQHLFAWIAWIVYGVPMEDPNCAFKLFRAEFLRRFPIQSDGDFVHVELVAKATFLTVLLDEVPLSPQNALPPRLTWAKVDRRKVFHKPKFKHPPVPAAI